MWRPTTSSTDNCGRDISTRNSRFIIEVHAYFANTVIDHDAGRLHFSILVTDGRQFHAWSDSSDVFVLSLIAFHIRVKDICYWVMRPAAMILAFILVITNGQLRLELAGVDVAG